MTREEALKKLHDEIQRHKAYGDHIAMDICCHEMEEIEAMTEEEYQKLAKLKKDYAALSVKPQQVGVSKWMKKKI